MEKENREEEINNHQINQITPAPDNFVPQCVIELDQKDGIVVKRKPYRRREAAIVIYL